MQVDRYVAAQLDAYERHRVAQFEASERKNKDLQAKLAKLSARWPGLIASFFSGNLFMFLLLYILTWKY